MQASSFIFAFRTRAIAFGIIAAGEAILMPGRVPFLMSAPGLTVIGLAVMMVGSFVEELGGLARIRAGNAVKLGAVGVALASLVWTLAIFEGSAFGWVFIAAGSVLVALAARFDAARMKDTRTGEDVRFESIDGDALLVRVKGREIIVPLRAVAGASVVKYRDGRGVTIGVTHRKLVRGEATSLPWVAATREGDILFLTEHQCNLDAARLAASINDRVEHPRERYR